MACAQRVGNIPADTHENDLLWEMGTLEAHGHASSPSLITQDYRGRSYLGWIQMRIATSMDPPWMSRGKRVGTARDRCHHLSGLLGQTLGSALHGMLCLEISYERR